MNPLSYTYDATSNRTSMGRITVPVKLPEPASNITYNQANQMLTFTPATASAKNMTYDANGNMTSVTNACGTTNYTWDARNRLIGITGFTSTCTSLTTSFKYDALGRRIERTVNGRTIQYLYDGLDVVQEIESGAVSANYVRTLNIDEPLARIEAGGKVRYYQVDALGSVIALTDEVGTARTQYSYDPYGNITASGEASDNPFQYTGRENDGTGLYYYRARYYTPELQRFISEDPIGLAGGINKFSYTQNNPINLTDPDGLQAETIAIGAGAGIGIGAGVAIGGAAALAMCYASPECQKYIKCFTKYLTDLATCLGKGICPSGEQEKTESCFKRAWNNYKACIRGWPRPHPDVYPP